LTNRQTDRQTHTSTHPQKDTTENMSPSHRYRSVDGNKYNGIVCEALMCKMPYL